MIIISNRETDNEYLRVPDGTNLQVGTDWLDYPSPRLVVHHLILCQYETCLVILVEQGATITERDDDWLIVFQYIHWFFKMVEELSSPANSSRGWWHIATQWWVLVLLCVYLF